MVHSPAERRLSRHNAGTRRTNLRGFFTGVYKKREGEMRKERDAVSLDAKLKFWLCTGIGTFMMRTLAVAPTHTYADIQ